MSWRRKPKGLAKEDAVLWQRVADSVKPLVEPHPLLTPTDAQALPQADEPKAVPPIPRPTPRNPQRVRANPKPPPVPLAREREVGRLDARAVRRIAKGRTAIEGRLDLHGMTREDAYARLADFLAFSRALGRRTVLVITGKGFAGEGVLRREVPRWLATPAFAPMVVGVEEAAVQHGGAGALYVRLRRAP